MLVRLRCTWQCIIFLLKICVASIKILCTAHSLHWLPPETSLLFTSSRLANAFCKTLICCWWQTTLRSCVITWLKQWHNNRKVGWENNPQWTMNQNTQERRLKRLITLGGLEIGIQHQIANSTCIGAEHPPPPLQKKKKNEKLLILVIGLV